MSAPDDADRARATDERADGAGGDAGRPAVPPLGLVGRWWTRVLFAPESTSSLAIIRILSGLAILGWAVSVTPDVHHFFGPDSIAPFGSTRDGRWTLLEWWGSSGAVTAIHGLLVLAAVSLTVGFHTRISAVVALVALLAFSRRNPWVVNSGDLLLRHLAFYAALAPGGVALSIDAWRKRGFAWVFPHRAPWVRRLMQVQLSVIYLSTVIAKAEGATWHAGTAVGYAVRIEDLVRFPTPDFVIDSILLVNLMTFGTLAAELVLGVLIWNKRLRPWVMGVGVLLHLSIDLTLTVGFFSYGMLALYPAFIEPASMDRFLQRLRARWLARRPRPAARASAG